MGDATPSPGKTMATLLDASFDLDLMDELLYGGDWLGIPDGSSFLYPGVSSSPTPFDPSRFSPLSETGKGNCAPEAPEKESESSAGGFYLSPSPQIQNQTDEALGSIPSPFNQDMGLIPCIKERLTHALRYIKESHREGDALVQMWVPVKRGDQQVLTTCGQPFWLDHNCQRLVNYRTVSTIYHFSAEDNCKGVLGLPGRVFVGKVPEWTPDVRLFSSNEYPRVNYAQEYDVRGSLAFPVFERGSSSCIGVVEIVMTTEKINYSSDLENVCNALQAVDLASSDVLGISRVKVRNDSYRTALPEISEVLRTVCQTHKLPLAQTWIPCVQQGKIGSRHSDENYKDCVSTVDIACYVNDPYVLKFHEACSEHHLFKGQGIVGKAFTTNQPCFSSDITSLSKTEYPLSHHARMFSLRGAVAIRLRSINTGAADFVLEFFLPVDCTDPEEQRVTLNSLSLTIQQACRTLRVVTEKELEEETALLGCNSVPSKLSSGNHISGEGPGSYDEEMHTVKTPTGPIVYEVGSSSFDGNVEAQHKGKGGAISPVTQLNFEEQDMPGFSVTTRWGNNEVAIPVEDIVFELKQNQQDLVNGINDNGNAVNGESRITKSGKAADKRRAKAEKTISLDVLRQYFAGSLKDAAKNLGVCPTTLKRICRQHGITRWPSRKIKKVGSSLQKLQKVIDSVQGVDGSFQFSSLYSPPGSDLIPQNAPAPLKPSDKPEPSTAQDCLVGVHASTSNSPTCSSSHTCGSSQSCSSGAKQGGDAAKLAVKDEPSVVVENQSDMIKRACTEVDLCNLTREQESAPVASDRDKSLVRHNSSESPSPTPRNNRNGLLLRVKAVYGEDKVRMKLQPSWGFEDLKLEILKRYNIDRTSSVDLKYLDDDSEWVLLTCDEDLQECIDVHKGSFLHTVKISVSRVAQPRSDGSQGMP